jgi:AAA15 family ATPase/GTPase
MKISKIHIQHFKRFTDLTIEGIPATTKLVVLVGPNGCGKTSLFEAFNYWYMSKGFSTYSDKEFNVKEEDEHQFNNFNWTSFIIANIVFHDSTETGSQDAIKGKFYFRSAYRNEPDFTINAFKHQQDPKLIMKYNLMSTDATVSDNYQRLVSTAISGLFKGEKDKKLVEELREEIIGKIRDSLKRLFSDLTLNGVGDDPLSNGSFFFEKGTVKDFHYKNLSAGEKSAFDLILDLIVKSNSFPNAVYCIDEPEAHMHTHLQTLLLNEIYNLIPKESQLWVATHSLGMLRRAQQLEAEHPGTVVFLDFDGRDFDSSVVITPAQIDGTILRRFMQLALDDYADFIAPQQIIFCEGNPKGHANPSFDAQVYTKIFGSDHPNTAFVSAGSCSEVSNKENESVKMITQLLSNSQVIRVVDRDDLSATEVASLLTKGVKTLSRRHIECYLLDDEIIKKLCALVGHPELESNCLAAKAFQITNSVNRGNPAEDMKSASGSIMVDLKRLLGMTRCGNTTESFLRDTISPLITPETNVYKELEHSIFG